MLTEIQIVYVIDCLGFDASDELAGVQYVGNPHFWVNEGRSYQEEGQKNTEGYIRGKAGTKLVCAVLSLPVSSKFLSPSGEQVNNFVTRTVPDSLNREYFRGKESTLGFKLLFCQG